MRNVIHLALIDIKIMVRDKLYLFWTLIFPLFFILVFGNLYKDSNADVKASLSVINKDQGKWGTYLIEKIKAPDIDLKIVEKEPQKYYRILMIPEDFSQKIEAKKSQNLIFKKESSASLEAAAQIETKIIQAIAKVITELILHPETETFFEKTKGFKSIIEIKSSFPEGAVLKVPSGFDHTIPGTLVQFIIMMVLIYGGISVMIDRQKGILCRILFSSISIPQLWSGKFIGRLLMGIIQALILLVTGMILFKLNLGNLLLTSLTVLFFSMAIASLGVLIGSIFNKEDLIIGISIFIALVFAGLGGCWWPIEIVSDTMKNIGMIVPSYWAMDAFHKIIFFKKGFADLLFNFGVLLGYTLLFSLISIKYFKFRD
ncbi:MAG: ABC transporter permease [Candidatus Aminicenantes bacterium]|nr:ABC transporter permease [Candidatus Aminicenantes bacterium]